VRHGDYASQAAKLPVRKLSRKLFTAAKLR
jgi:hypothetical protein